MVSVNPLASAASSSLSLLLANQSAAAGKDAAAQPAKQAASVAATPANSVSSATSAAITTLTPQPSAPNASEASSDSVAQSPAANTSSTANESLAQIATDARATLSANLAAMSAAGNPMNWNSTSQTGLNNAFAGLDPNSLYAIASDTGGLFTSDEQEQALGIIDQQLTQAMGLSDPTAFLDDPVAGYSAGLKYMEGFSPQVQNTPFWQVYTASLQVGYEDTSKSSNTSASQNSDQGSTGSISSNPVVQLLTKLIHQADGTSFSVFSNSFITNLNQIPLFAQHSSELQQATAELSAQNSALGIAD